MVARTPTKQLHHLMPKKVVAPLDPVLLRQTLIKVDKCMERLKELQYTVTGGHKVVAGITLSPRSTRGYLRTSLRCKQESLRIKNGNSRRSPGKLPTSIGDWRKMSLPAMLLGETVGEILEASQFAKEIAEVVAPKKANTIKNQQVSYDDDPKTPLPKRRIATQRRASPVNSELLVRRKREKQMANQTTTPSLQRARSRIHFKVSSPPLQKGGDFGSNRPYMVTANRVSPRHRPWSKKTVLFPNPLFNSSPTSKQHNFCRTKSPVLTAKKNLTPHKFLIKSPVKIRSPPLSISPTRGGLGRVSPKMSAAARIRGSFSPSRLAKPVSISPTRVSGRVPSKMSAAARIRGSLSPSRLAKPLSISPTRVSPKMSAAARLRRSFSPSRLVKPLSVSPTRAAGLGKMSTAAKIRRSFSPSKLANRLVSPLKSRKSVPKSSGGMMKSADEMMKMMSGLKQRPNPTSMRC